MFSSRLAVHTGARVIAILAFCSTVWFGPNATARAESAAGDKPQHEVVQDLEAISRAFRDVSHKARPGVVHISSLGGEMTVDEKKEALENAKRRGRQIPEEDQKEFLDTPMPKSSVSGSGMIYDTDGYIVTNNHVVGGRTNIQVELDDGRKFAAKVVGVDPKTDVAVLKIDAPNLSPIPFGNSDQVDVGDWVIAVGAPFGLTHTVTHGIVSAKGRAQVPDIEILYQDFIQTDAAINPGNSGGPLLNLRAEVIGINTAIATNGDAYNAGIAFTIPSNRAVKVVEQLKKRGEVQRGWLGISFESISAQSAQILGLENHNAALVGAVFAGTPAQQAGFQVEDAIVEIDGMPVESTEQMRWMIADLTPGEQVNFKVVRDGRTMTLPVKLGLQPPDMARSMQTAITGRPIDPLGLLVRTFTPGDRNRRTPYNEDDRGVMVLGFTSDREDSHPRDVSPRDLLLSVNNHTVRNAADLARELKQERGTLELKFMEPDRSTKIVKFKPRS